MATRAGRPVADYLNPLRGASVTPERVDQGVDYAGSGPLHAFGPGVIEQVLNAGWPGGAFIAERLTSGPLAGQYVFQAEDISPRVHVGQKVTAGTVIGDLHGGMEIGFAAPPPNLGQALAYIKGESNYNGDPGAHPTAEGVRMSDWIVRLGGPAGLISGKPVGATIGGSGNSPGSPGSGGILASLRGMAIAVPVVIGALALGVWGIARATGASRKIRQSVSEAAGTAAQVAPLAAL
jgi:hypothetical protein